MAIILSCAGSFKVLMQSVFPGFMNGFMSSTGGKGSKSRPRPSHLSYALQSRDTSNRASFQTVLGASRHARTKKDDQSVESREHIVNGAAEVQAWWKMDATISVHSSKRGSIDETARGPTALDG